MCSPVVPHRKQQSLQADCKLLYKMSFFVADAGTQQGMKAGSPLRPAKIKRGSALQLLPHHQPNVLAYTYPYCSL